MFNLISLHSESGLYKASFILTNNYTKVDLDTFSFEISTENGSFVCTDNYIFFMNKFTLQMLVDDLRENNNNFENYSDDDIWSKMAECSQINKFKKEILNLINKFK